jgi:hypothetical protein
MKELTTLALYQKKFRSPLIVLALFLIFYFLWNIQKIGFGEWLASAIFILTITISFFIGKDLTGMIFCGIIIGVFVEFLTEMYWDYSMKVYIYKDISLFVIMGWGYQFAFFVLLSNWLFKKVFRTNGDDAFKKRLLLFDTVFAPIFFIPHELIAMKWWHLWKYSDAAGWTHLVPLINFPLEAILGSMLLGLLFPTFVRHWEKSFRFTISIR